LFTRKEKELNQVWVKSKDPSPKKFKKKKKRKGGKKKSNQSLKSQQMCSMTNLIQNKMKKFGKEMVEVASVNKMVALTTFMALCWV